MGAVTSRQARSSRPASCDPGTILPIAGLHVLRHTAAKHRGVIGEATRRGDQAERQRLPASYPSDRDSRPTRVSGARMALPWHESWRAVPSIGESERLTSVG